MTRRFNKKRPSFITLPRHKRSNEVIRLKGRIKRDSDEYGGMFTSHLVLDEPGDRIYTISGLTSISPVKIGSQSGMRKS